MYHCSPGVPLFSLRIIGVPLYSVEMSIPRGVAFSVLSSLSTSRYVGRGSLRGVLPVTFLAGCVVKTLKRLFCLDYVFFLHSLESAPGGERSLAMCDGNPARNADGFQNSCHRVKNLIFGCHARSYGTSMFSTRLMVHIPPGFM